MMDPEELFQMISGAFGMSNQGGSQGFFSSAQQGYAANLQNYQPGIMDMVRQMLMPRLSQQPPPTMLAYELQRIIALSQTRQQLISQQISFNPLVLRGMVTGMNAMGIAGGDVMRSQMGQTLGGLMSYGWNSL